MFLVFVGFLTVLFLLFSPLGLYTNLPAESSQFSLTRPTRLDKIKNFRDQVQAGTLVLPETRCRKLPLLPQPYAIRVEGLTVN